MVTICHEPVAQGVSSTIWLPLAWWLAIIAHKLALACKVPYTLALLHWWHEYVLCAVTGAMVLASVSSKSKQRRLGIYTVVFKSEGTILIVQSNLHTFTITMRK